MNKSDGSSAIMLLRDTLQAVALYAEAEKLSSAPYRTTAASVFKACFTAKQWSLACDYIQAALPDPRYTDVFSAHDSTPNSTVAAQQC